MIELTTQCPQCHYQFTVTLQQLQQRKGVSRCPQCAHIFDAYDQAVQSDDLATQTAVASAPFTPPPSNAHRDLPQSIELSLADQVVPPKTSSEFSELSSTADPKSGSSPEDSELRWHFIGKEPLASGVPNAPAPGTQFSISGLNTGAHAAPMDDVRVFLDRERPPHVVASTDHIHLAEARHRPRSTSVRSKENKTSHPLWGALLFILLCCAAVQLVYVYRVQLANSVKLTRPLLEMMCEVAGCEIPYMREINAIDITQSTLKQQAPSSQTPSSYSYLLQLQMQNTLAWDQEWPTLVLSFSDAAAAVMATVAVPPEQYLPRSQRSRPFEAGALLTIRLPITVANKKINGFTVDKYYP